MGEGARFQLKDRARTLYQGRGRGRGRVRVRVRVGVGVGIEILGVPRLGAFEARRGHGGSGVVVGQLLEAALCVTSPGGLRQRQAWEPPSSLERRTGGVGRPAGTVCGARVLGLGRPGLF